MVAAENSIACQKFSEMGARTFEVVLLLYVEDATRQKAEADHAVHHDHDDGEHRVARQRRIGYAFQHYGGDQRHLDDDHRNGEDERAERLTEKIGQRVGVTDDAEDAAGDSRHQPDEQHAALGELSRIGEPGAAVNEKQAERRRPDEERRLAADAALPALMAGLFMHAAISCRQ
jgi:hypothetical protein